MYPDDPKIKNQFDILNEFYIYVYILHDSDEDTHGKLKKPHYHVILSLPNNSPTNVDSIKSRLQLDYVEGVRSVRSAMRYLVHADDPDKFQYEKFNLLGSPVMVSRCKSYLATDLNGSIHDVVKLLNSIDGPVGYTSFLELCCENQLAGTLRNVKIELLLREHNNLYFGTYEG